MGNKAKKRHLGLKVEQARKNRAEAKALRIQKKIDDEAALKAEEAALKAASWTEYLETKGE